MASTVSFAKNSKAPNQGLLKHNNREGRYADAENIDKSRSHHNVTYKKEDLKEVYTELFQKSVDDYNEKQKRADRRIGDYYSKIVKSGNKEKLFQEVVVALVEKDEKVEPDTDAWEHQKIILDRYAKTFEVRNPNLRVFNSVMHLDEASPHLHLSFIPIAEGYKTGMNVRNSFDKSFKDRYGSKDGVLEWYKDEREYLHTLSQEMGLETTVIGEKRKDYSLPEYKQAMRASESLIERNKELEDINTHLIEKIAENALKSQNLENKVFDLEEVVEELKRNNLVLKDEINIITKKRDKYKDNLEAVKDFLKEVKLIDGHEPATATKKGFFHTSIETDWKASYEDLKTKSKKLILENARLEETNRSKDETIKTKTEELKGFKKGSVPNDKHDEVKRKVQFLEKKNEKLEADNEALARSNTKLTKQNESLQRENRGLRKMVFMVYEWADEHKEKGVAYKSVYKTLEKFGVGDQYHAEQERARREEQDQKQSILDEIKRLQEKQKREKEKNEPVIIQRRDRGPSL